ncbi:MAG: NeuD/PglB/VioB family sugar acetyltransferase [Acidimicrobiales bacterium]
MLNPNEPEAVLVEHSVAEGGTVAVGDVLCVLETSKSTDEVAAANEGFVVGWTAAPGELVNAGDVLCFIADSPAWVPPPAARAPDSAGDPGRLPEGLRITQPALRLAMDNGVELARLPIGPLVTAATVQTLLGEQAVAAVTRDGASDDDPTALVVYGGGGHGKTLIELVRMGSNYHLVGVVDNQLELGGSVLGVPVLGGDASLSALRQQGTLLAVNGVGGIARVADRVGAFDRLTTAGFAFPALVHPSAVVEPSARIGPGAQVLAHAYVGSDAQVGFGTIVNTGAVVSHDCVLDDYVNLSPGVLLAGGARVRTRSLVGMGVTVNIGVEIGQRVRIGNSAVVKADVPDGQVVSAGSVWPAARDRR